jgi:hypothetical protein
MEKLPWSIVVQSPSSCLEALEKIRKHYSRESCSSGRDLMLGLFEYEEGVLSK